MQNLIYTLKWSMPFTASVFMNLITAVHLYVQNTFIAFNEIQPSGLVAGTKLQTEVQTDMWSTHTAFCPPTPTPFFFSL